MQDTFYSLLCLIILAMIANRTKKTVLSASIFALLKTLGYIFLQLNLIEEGMSEMLWAPSILQFVINGMLGYGIAVITAKHSKDSELMVVNLILAIITFLTGTLSLAIF